MNKKRVGNGHRVAADPTGRRPRAVTVIKTEEVTEEDTSALTEEDIMEDMVVVDTEEEEEGTRGLTEGLTKEVVDTSALTEVGDMVVVEATKEEGTSVDFTNFPENKVNS